MPDSLLVFTVVPHLYVGTLLAVVARRHFVMARPFSWKRFYATMGWAPLTFVVLAIAIDPRYLLLFFACGVGGVIGELIVSVTWRFVFGTPIWTYSNGAFFAGFSSTLNFLPWAVGGFLFHAASLFFSPEALVAHVGLLHALEVGAMALVLGALAACPWLLWKRGSFDGRRFGVFCIPIGVVMVALGGFVSWQFVPLMLAFSILGFATEYGYGKVMGEVFSRSLWRYHPWPIDGGHASFVSIPLWALGGLFFFFITQAVMGG